MKSLKAWIALLSLGVVGATVWWEMSRLTSPGPLHPSHAPIASLRGASGCAACHGDERVSMTDACLVCHDAIAKQIDNSTGMHSPLNIGAGISCASCHFEHTGGSVALTGPRAFALAGVPSIDEYAHEHVEGFTLSGVHASLDCQRCHRDARAFALDEGSPRFLGLSQACTACHDDPHDGDYGSSCADCHGQEHPFDQVAAFEHDPRFPLVDAHAGIACASCHEAGSLVFERSGSAGASPVRTCAQCHESPHRREFLVGVSRVLEVPLPELTCEGCHSVAHESFSPPDEAFDIGLHAMTGFALSEPHHEVSCAQCHESTDPDAAFALRFPGRGPDDCHACHADPHDAQFGRVPEEVTCLQCHERTRWEPSTFGPAEHARAGFALTGAHEPLQCASCHDADAEVRPFRGVDTRCASCHDDPHAGQFDVDGRAPDCAACHSTNAFAPSLIDAETHAGFTFALTGAHERVSCAECHADVGGVSRFRGAPDACAACHDDPHAGQFRDIPGGERCDTCHETGAFTPATFDLDDHARAGFALVGAHLGVACTACHEEVGEVRRFHATPARCAECHEDVHAGAFDHAGVPVAINGREGCARCHTAESFHDISMSPSDHARWTGFPLDGAHASARCVQCHVPDPRARTRRVLGTAPERCDQCHADPHAGQFRRRGVTECAECHTTGVFTRTTFDHQVDSAFALDEFHATLACAACHKTWKTGDGTPVVRYRPLGSRCEDCHDNRGH